MSVTVRELAELVGGRVHGNAELPVAGAATLQDVLPGQITFVDQEEKLSLVQRSDAVAAIVPAGLAVDGLATIEVSDVHAAFTAVVSHFRPPRHRRRRGISQTAFISPSARLGYDVDVYPGASIGDDVQIGAGSTIHSGVQIMAGSKIGEQVTIFPNAVLYHDTQIGDRCTIHAGTVLGADGFGYKTVDGRHQLAAQLGHVEIGPDVEIGAGSTIDRGTYGPTRIGAGTKIDDQVMIAHNCQIGRHNLICSQVGLAGSSSTGDYVVIAGQAGIRDHVRVGNRVVVGAMTGIMGDVRDDSCMLGIPATTEREQWLKQAALAKLPEMRRQLRVLARAVEQLQNKTEAAGDQSDDQSAAA